MAILKSILGWVAKIAIPGLLKLLAKSNTKFGKLVKESMDVYDMVKSQTSDDGVLDEEEIQKLSPEVIQAFIALFNVIDRKFQIRIKKKK